MNILVVGYMYIKESNADTFKFYPKEGKVFFLVPKFWSTKMGKATFTAPRRENFFSGKAFFFHSHYPLIGGLLKGWIPAFPLMLWRLKRSQNIKLVYSCSEPLLLTTLYYGMWTKIMGLKFIAFSWENIPYIEKYRGIGRFPRECLVRLNFMIVDGFICGNKKCITIHQPYARGKPMIVLPGNGVDPEFFKRKDNNRIFRESNFQGKIVFAFIGAIGKRKGIDLILKAFPEVLKQISSAHLVIAGGGEDEAAIEAEIIQLNLSAHVTRIPWLNHDEMVHLLSACDVFMYPSISYKGWEEQFGYAMAEASLMELPIISTRSGSIEDVVVHNETGILTQPGNIVELGQAMIRLGKDQHLRHTMGVNGRKYIINNFSHQTVANKLLEFFSRFNKA